ncbi:unnamed protein product [Lactuca virosa]|uniref:Uncharacterized protein n=1 Tax=Lactuca virosa TaxID=75947 RepID=A0AAU9NQH1_9ASTR|nr:unnamed protein product [Lactuca virosa]
MASRPRRNQPGSRPDFPWYTFPRNVGPKVYTRWNAKLDWLKQRKVHVPAVVDWQWMSETGLMEAIEPYLDKSFNGVHGQFFLSRVEADIPNSRDRVQRTTHRISSHGVFCKEGWHLY